MRAILIAAAAFGAAYVPSTLATNSGTMSAILWPVAGVEFTLLLIFGKRAVLPLMAGLVPAAWLATSMHPIQGMFAACLEVVLIWGMALAYRKWGGYRGSLEGMRPILGLLLVLCGGMALIAPYAGVQYVWFALTTWENWLPTVTDLWLSVVASMMIFAPLILSTAESGKKVWAFRGGQFFEAFLLLGGLAATATFIVPSRMLQDPFPVLPFFVFPFFIWAALRFGVLGVSWTGAVLALVSFERFFFSGTFTSTEAMRAAMIFYQLLLCVVMLMGLVVAGAIADRRRAIEGLEQTVDERTRELREANAGKDRLLSVIGHDMRSPLFGIVKLSEYLVDSSRQISPDKLVAYASQLHESAKLQHELMENLLSWSRFQTGQAEFHPDEQPAISLIEPVLNLFRLRAGLKQIVLRLDCPEDLRVRADTEMARTVVRNLLSNALRATPEGGEILISAWPQGGERVAVCVRDSGSGMTPEQVAALLSKSDAIETHSGLGLLLGQEFARRHGWPLEIESAPCCGTTVRFFLSQSI